MDEGRGFTLSHQRVVLDIDLAGTISASAHLTIQPTSPNLRTVYLHASPLLHIHGVTLSSPTPTEALLPTPVSYALSQPFQPLPFRDPPMDIRSHPEIKRKTWSAINERDEGELAISVTGGWIRLIEGEMTLAPIEIQIDYHLAVGGGVVEGIVFDGDCVYLSPTAYDSARIWTPCLDNLWERCTWELEFIVPATIDDTPVMVISSGELTEQITHPHSHNKTIFYYLQANPVSVQHIAFAAGPFETHVIAETPKPILGFCLPGDMNLLINSTTCLPRTMTFFSADFGVYPFTEFKLVFVPGLRTPSVTSATLGIFSSDLLYPETVIDQAMTTRQTLTLALIQQWIGINIIQRTLADTWLIHGLALYLNGLFLRQLLGNNEYRFRLKKDIERCVRLDQGDQWPLCMPGSLDPPDIPFVNLKAPLVLHILDRHLATAGTSAGLTKVISRILLAAFSDQLPGNTLSTQFFFKTCRKVSGLDLQTFQDQWVFGSGCPQFRIHTNFIRKKFIVELYMSQVIRATSRRATPLFEGGLTVRIHEADGAPFEHVVDIKSAQKTYNLPFNTKYKRTRRSGHIAARFKQLQEDLAAEDDTPEEAQPKSAEVFAYPPWEDDDERQRWKVAEWNDEQVEAMMSEGGGYEWIRIDPDCEWLASFEFTEKPWYWISQLQSDRDVIAQLEAIQNMALVPSPVVASELAKAILVPNYFYRVRMEAARALINYSSAESEYIGLFYLLKIYQTLYCQDSSDPLEADFVLGKNDFSDFAGYFLQKAIITSLANLRDPTSWTSWRNVRRFLLSILQANDNTTNAYSDGHFLATVVAAVGNAFCAMDGNDEGDQELLREAADSVNRIVTMDRLVPSFQNVITQAGLKTQLKLIMAGQLTNNPRMFLSYTREGNFEPVRTIAFDCLLISRPPGRTAALIPYLMDVVRNDQSLSIRRHVARALAEAIVMSLALGDVAGSAPPGLLDMTNDTDQARAERASAHSKAIVKAIRNEFGRRPDLREAIQSTLISSFTAPDHAIRFAMIKLAEMTTASINEPLPGSLITLSTPIVETPTISTPKIRLSVAGTPGPGSGPGRETDYGFPEMPAPTLPAIKLKVAPTVPPKKKTSKSQSSGLSDEDRLMITRALDRLTAHQISYWFRAPVDEIRDGAPGYSAKIKQPMDLSTSRAKLQQGLYSTRQDFVRDMQLIVSNCFIYNEQGTEINRAGKDFETFFTKLWAKLESTLSRSKEGPSITSAPVEPPAPARTSGPSTASSAPFKLKVKPIKPSNDGTPVEIVPPMAPPPVPPSRRTFFVVPAEPNKKRKPVTANTELDDLLGAEVDAIGKSPADAGIEDLLEPKPKKMKLPKAEPAPSTDKPRPTITFSKPASTEKKRHASPEKKRQVSPEKKKVKPPPAALPPPPPEPVQQAAPIVVPPVGPYRPPVPPADFLATKSDKHPIRIKRAKVLVSALQKDPSAVIFLRPVDPIMDGCPTYLDEIKEPMDLGTIMKKVETKKYKTWGQLAYDIELIFANCRKFNRPGDGLVECADALQVVYWKEWVKAVSPKMLPSEKREISGILSKLLKDPLGYFFKEAVDPVALGIPTYFTIIPEEDARDLSLIKRQVDKGTYDTFQKVDENFDLMLENARVFNGEGAISDAANDLGKLWTSLRHKMDTAG